MTRKEKFREDNQKHKPYGPYERWLKRPLDFVCALTVILLFWWLYIILAIMVRIKLGSPVLFTQERPGKDEKIFKLYKFRSMTNEKDEKGKLLPDEARLTKFGKWLRSTSLDELPEIFNILKGDMSLIGPRPLLVEYLPLYNEEQKHRHDVRPGLTGLAMSKVRNGAGWEKKFELDLKYVRHVTLLTDIRIIFDTVRIVLRREGINEPGFTTNSKFRGDLK